MNVTFPSVRPLHAEVHVMRVNDLLVGSTITAIDVVVVIPAQVADSR
jgi:hypothetical protein